MSNDQPEKRSYEVGYGKPPREHRFKPGQSGNPRGRPKRSKSKPPSFMEILNEPVKIVKNGTTREVPGIEAIIRSLLAKGAQGDHRSVKLLFELVHRQGESILPKAKMSSEELDAEIMDRLKRIRAAHELNESEQR